MRRAYSEQVKKHGKKAFNVIVALSLVVGLAPNLSFAGQQQSDSDLVVDGPINDAVLPSQQVQLESADDVVPSGGEASMTTASAATSNFSNFTVTSGTLKREHDGIAYYDGAITFTGSVADADFAEVAASIGALTDGAATDDVHPFSVTVPADALKLPGVVTMTETDSSGGTAIKNFPDSGAATRAVIDDAEPSGISIEWEAVDTEGISGTAKNNGVDFTIADDNKASAVQARATITVKDYNLRLPDETTLNDDSADHTTIAASITPASGGTAKVEVAASGWAPSKDATADDPGEYTCVLLFTGAGSASIEVKAVDWADHAASQAFSGALAATVDGIAPKLSVGYGIPDSDYTVHDGKLYYGAVKNIDVSVDEKYDNATLSASLAKVGIEDPTNVALTFNSANEKYSGTASLVADGEYTLRVSGKDAVGNDLEEAESSDLMVTGGVYSQTIIVDTQAPVITTTYENAADESAVLRDGGEAYTADTKATVKVSDSSFNPDATTVKVGGNEQTVEWSAATYEEGVPYYTAEITLASEDTVETPNVITVDSTDLTGHAASYSATLTVDKAAPVISISWSPGDGAEVNGVATKFFKSRTATITVTDPALIPDGRTTAEAVSDYLQSAVILTASGGLQQEASPGVYWEEVSAGASYKTTVKFGEIAAPEDPTNACSPNCDLKVEAQDVFGNNGEDDSTTAFATLSSPIIDVQFDPASPSGTFFTGDPDNDNKLTVTVTVLDPKFDTSEFAIDSSGVEPDDSAKVIDKANWTSDGVKHVAQLTYTLSDDSAGTGTLTITPTSSYGAYIGSGEDALAVGGYDAGGSATTLTGDDPNRSYKLQFSFDNVKPALVDLAFDPPSVVAAGTVIGGVLYVNASLKASIVVEEENLDDAQNGAPVAVTKQKGAETAESIGLVVDSAANPEKKYKNASDIELDAVANDTVAYTLSFSGTDLAGNGLIVRGIDSNYYLRSGDAYTTMVVIDQTKPTLAVSYKDAAGQPVTADEVDKKLYSSGAITATVTVVDDNPVSDLDAVSVSVGANSYPLAQATDGQGQPLANTYAVDVPFPAAEGEAKAYELTVSGMDAAGNDLTCADADHFDATEHKYSATVVVDNEKPELTVSYVPYASGTTPYTVVDAFVDPESGVVTTPVTYYYNSVVTVTASVEDGALIVADGVRSSLFGTDSASVRGAVFSATNAVSTDGVYDVVVSGADAVGNALSPQTDVTRAGMATDAAANPAAVSYKAKVVVDTARPTVAVSYQAEGESAWTALAHGAVGSNAGLTGKTTSIRMEFADANFSADAAYTSIKVNGGVPDGIVWEGNVATFSVAAMPGDTAYYHITANTTDLAGNKLDASGAETDSARGVAYEAELYVDQQAPRLSVAFDGAEQTMTGQNTVDELRYYKADQTVSATVKVVETGKALAADKLSLSVVDSSGVAVDGAVQDVSWTMPSVAGSGADRVVTYEAKITLAAPVLNGAAVDETYTIAVSAVDESGNKMVSSNAAGNADPFVSEGTYTSRLCIDATAPKLTVTWTPTAATNGKYFNSVRTATVTIEEVNFDPAQLTVAMNDGAPIAYTADGAWSQSGSAYTLTEAFTFDEAADDQVLVIRGKDRANNDLVLASDSSTGFDASPIVMGGAYVSAGFVVDLTNPVVTFTTSQARSDQFAGTDYFRSGNQFGIAVSVSDRNFAPRTDRANATTLVPAGTNTEEYDKNRWADDGTYVMTFSPNDSYGAAERNALSAVVYDLAGNKTEIAYGDAPDAAKGKTVDSAGAELKENASFALDVTAPVVVPGNGSDIPSRVYSGNYSDTLVFYKDATTLRVVVNDVLGIRSIVGEGGDYSFTAVNGSMGDKSWALDVALRNGVEFTSSFLLTATDLAGNVRQWTINPKSLDVDDVSGSDRTNTPLYDAERDLYPAALILDTTAPVVGMSGAIPGTYYNATQTVTTRVEELNFGYLQRYDGSQVVVTMTKQEGNAGRLASTQTVPASQFVGADSVFTHRFALSDDGHYSFVAHVTDPAGNEGSAALGEFTIDKTAPVASVSWDNTDVRNGKYYAATRTATVTVVEHNFDANRISFSTTGSVGSWVHNGDTHVVQVSFMSDGAYSLTVTGADLAGNAMNELTEPEFVVDMTAPNIDISVVEDARAYGKGVAVAPVITYTDEANFDPNGTSYMLSGTKNGEVAYTSGASDGDNSRTVTYLDFGRTDDGGDNPYDSAADDIYTLSATMTDMAGNQATPKSVTFSVNRYGSTYRVMDDTLVGGNALLTEAPEIRIQEINVSGTLPEKNSIVVSPDGSSQRYLEMNAVAGDTGYTVTESTSAEGASRGWSTYTYSIAPGNFERLDARYHVVVTSEDRATNRNTSTGYYDRAKKQANAKAEVVFTLDENPPEIVGLHITGSEFDEDYVGEFTVHEDIGIAGLPVVKVDGQSIEVEEQGANSYSFKVPSRSFIPSRHVSVEVRDLADHTGTADENIISLLIALPIGVVAIAAVAAAVITRSVRRKHADEK